MEKFSDIITRKQLAQFLEVKLSQLTYILYKQGIDSNYHSFSILKRDGGFRRIDAPKNVLLKIQMSLVNRLWEVQESIWENKGYRSKTAHAFIKGRGIITNAKIHRKKRFVINLDLENFFGSIHFGRVKGFFQKNKYFNMLPEIATIIAQLTCYKGCLPQGAPSSPIISNLICQILDLRLRKIAKKYRLDYTRYADDLTFSTNADFISVEKDFFSEIKVEIERAGFHMNDRKTRIQDYHHRQNITGLVVNEKLNVNSDYCRQTRAMAHNLYTKGTFTIGSIEGTMDQIEGRFSFINQLDWYNNQANNKANKKKNNFLGRVDAFNKREKEYMKFLFYKYFWQNKKPLIITEGKTDVRYLKSALKSLSLEYPELVNVEDDGGVKFLVSFLNKTRRLEYFLGINRDGGDTLTNLYSNYFDIKRNEREAGTNGRNNKSKFGYIEYFKKYSSTERKAPIILFFDNELSIRNKPLNKFSVKLNSEEKNRLKTNGYIQLNSDMKLFVMTMKLAENQTSCEIEDLFDERTLCHEDAKGRSFSREDRPDLNEFYGKDYFSKYVYSNYKQINFEKFKEVFNTIRSIMDECNYQEE